MIEVLLIAGAGALVAKVTELSWDAWRRSRIERSSLTLSTSADVAAWGWDTETLLRHLIALDYRLLGEDLTEEREGTVAQWAPVFAASPDSWVLLSAGKRRIVGYFAFVALTEAHYAAALRGELLDSQVTVDTLAPLDTPGRHNLYFVLIGVLPEFRGAGTRLIDAFFNQLESFAARGVFFERICANAFSKSGKRLCEGFGMSAIGPHKDFGTVYSMQLVPWPSKLRYPRWDSLAAQYDRIVGGPA